MKEASEVPYVFFCPSVLRDLKNRMFKDCNLYHAFKKSMMKHRKDVHSKKATRIAARRKRE